MSISVEPPLLYKILQQLLLLICAVEAVLFATDVLPLQPRTVLPFAPTGFLCAPAREMQGEVRPIISHYIFVHIFKDKPDHTAGIPLHGELWN